VRNPLLVILAVFLPALLPDAPARAAASEGPVAVSLASDGKAALPVVVSADASERSRKAAESLAEYLGRISGAKFAVTTGDGTTGIAVGRPADFPSLALPKWDPADPAKREDYLLRCHGRGLHVIGATDLAVEHAVWDLLYRLGYRQFFPGKTWEVVPEIRDLSIAVDVQAHPDYYARRIWYGYGPWDYAAGPYAEWCTRNRGTSGFVLNTGHAYQGIISRNKKTFDTHPEYLGLLDGERKSSKLCISNPGLRQLVVDDALRRFAARPEIDSVSVDPSDGGGWCECEKCKAIGSISDRALTLANEVAAAIERKYPNKRVGMYAYAYHSPPPGIRVHRKVIVSVANGFIKGGFTHDELISGWSDQGATLGIREYYSVSPWDRDMPGRARGGNLPYLARTIPEFHGKAARYMSAESSDNWGPNGLGYYFAARVLWDIGEADRREEIVDDFLTRAFGLAKKPMAEFYNLIDSSNPALDFDDRLGRMFRRLDEARKLADTPAVKARIDDLILYARYVDLFDRYRSSSGPVRQAAFEAMIRHVYRMRKTMMVHAKALYRDVAARDKKVSIPPEAGWGVPEERNPWKSTKPFSQRELEQFVAKGISGRPLVELDFKPTDYSGRLVPAVALDLPEVTPGTIGAGRGVQTFYTWVENAPGTVELRITGGLIKHYRDRGNVRIQLWSLGDADEKPVGRPSKAVHDSRKSALDGLGGPSYTDRSVPPDGVERTVTLRTKRPGLHKITVSDGNDMTKVGWAPGTPMTLKSSIDQPINVHGRWSLYFYVPKGTKIVGLHGRGGAVLDGGGEKVFTFGGKKATFHSIDVPKDQDGKLWKIDDAAGAIRLLTVPPYFARSGDELLLPAEVVR